MQLTAWVIESRNVCRQLERHSAEGTVSHDIPSIFSGARFLSLAGRKGKTGMFLYLTCPTSSSLQSKNIWI